MKNIFEELLSINLNEHTENKNGLPYLSWTYAISEIKKKCPDFRYEILKFENNLPYVYDENTGYMVFTRVTIGEETNEMWLPVMDGNNKAMLNHSYTYKVKEYGEDGKFTGQYKDKSVEAATMFDINKTIMRCLVKNIAMFGLGLYIYSGEDFPEGYEISKEEAELMIVNFGKYKGKTLKEIKSENETYLNWIVEQDADYIKQSLKDACAKLVEATDDEKVELTRQMLDLVNELGIDMDKISKKLGKNPGESLTKEETKKVINTLQKEKAKKEEGK